MVSPLRLDSMTPPGANASLLNASLFNEMDPRNASPPVVQLPEEGVNPRNVLARFRDIRSTTTTTPEFPDAPYVEPLADSLQAPRKGTLKISRRDIFNRNVNRLTAAIESLQRVRNDALLIEHGNAVRFAEE